jgi:hypothetical protein
MTGDKSPEGQAGLEVAARHRVPASRIVNHDPELLISGQTVQLGTAIAVAPGSAAPDDVRSGGPARPCTVARAALHVDPETAKPLLNNGLQILQTSGEVVTRTVRGMGAHVEGLQEAKKKDAIGTMEKAE